MVWRLGGGAEYGGALELDCGLVEGVFFSSFYSFIYPSALGINVKFFFVSFRLAFGGSLVVVTLEVLPTLGPFGRH